MSTQEFSKAFRQYQDSRFIVCTLRDARYAAGISDAEMCSRLGWQSPDLEDWDEFSDGEISLRDLTSIASALKLNFAFFFEPADDSPEAKAAYGVVNRAMGDRK